MESEASDWLANNPLDISPALFNQLMLIMLKKGYLVEKDGEITTAKEPPANEPATLRIWRILNDLTQS